MKQHVYIIGSKGIPARYGGYETFVDQLTLGQTSPDIVYHVAARSDNSEYGETPTFNYHNAEVYNIKVPNLGSAQAIYYDVKALSLAIKDANRIQDEAPIFYILACRIGPFMHYFKNKIHAIGGRYYINPDGHEWKRAKWPAPVRAYWKYSERLMIKNSDLVICDNRKIEEYIQDEYQQFHPRTTFIAYGTDIRRSTLQQTDIKVRAWFEKHKVVEKEYYLIVGRFVPENNYRTMIQEFLRSHTTKQLVIVTNVSKNKFYEQLKSETHFNQDSRINFVGTVYDQPLLKYIRENAFAYLHGHEVGGTNPSLLEALSSTPLNLLIDVGFNRDVASNAALYWTKDSGSLSDVINRADKLDEDELVDYQNKALNIIQSEYTWPKIIGEYEDLFLKQ